MVLLLGGCIFCMKQIVIKEFAYEYNLLIEHLKTIKPPAIQRVVESEKKAIEELNNLIKESDLVEENLGINKT